jgi:hypothetical protein
MALDARPAEVPPDHGEEDGGASGLEDVDPAVESEQRLAGAVPDPGTAPDLAAGAIKRWIQAGPR